MYLHWDESQSLRDDLVVSTTSIPGGSGTMDLMKLERLLKDDPMMEWYYDYATGQLHNGVRWHNNKENEDDAEVCSGPKCNAYRGLQTVTRKGKTCQAWNTQFP